MDSPWLALMEAFVVLAVVLGWAVLELLTLRRDRRKAERAAAERPPDAAPPDRPPP
jgi:hypothetical protein